jgi:arabinofuranosyltransferase
MLQFVRIFRRLKAWRWPDWLAVLILIAAAGMFVSQCLWLGDANVDDAFITFSFSKNLALGNGPVYSNGVRVEGYSNFLWMVLLALPLLITRGAAPVTSARIMGAPFVLLLGWAVYRIARSCGVSRPVAAFCVLLLSFKTDLAVAYLTGLETLPYTALIAFAFAAAAQSFTEDKWQKIALWAGLAVALTRIDGFALFGFLLAWMFLRGALRRKARPLRHLLFWFLRLAGPPLLVYLLWFAWRWHYYGLLLPSTYYAKSLIPELMPTHGFDYVSKEVTSGWFGSSVLAWLWLLWRRRSAAVLFGTFAFLHLVYVVKVGGDWMPFGRFILPVVPLLVTLLVVGSANLIRTTFRARVFLRWLTPIVPLPFIIMVAIRADHRYLNSPVEQEKTDLAAGMTSCVSRYMDAAKFLRKIVPSRGRLVTDYGGVFAYYTDGTIIEMWGLANATIGTRGNTEGVKPIFGKTCPACYPELHPEYFHVMEPLLRREPALRSTEEVIANVWQTDTIGRYIDFKATFAAGRVFRPATNESLYFLRKRENGIPLVASNTPDGFVIEYPFETQQTANHEEP